MDYPDFGLCEGLSKAGADVTLYTSDETVAEGDTPYELRLVYRDIYGADPAWLRGFRYVRGTFEALLNAKRKQTQVVHFHFFHVGPLELFNMLLAKVLRFHVVATAHDVQSFVERLSVPWMVKIAYRISDKVIAQSKVSRQELVTNLKIPESKIYTIPLGNYLNAPSKVPSQQEARVRLGLLENSRILLFFGQIKEIKGLDVLLQAMPRIVEEYSDVLLLIAGRVWKDDFLRYQKQIDALGIGDYCVAHVRYIPNSEIATYYAATDLVVLPYRKIYQSAVLLMAMGYGRPVMVSGIEGMTEMVEDGANGYVFASGDASALADKLIEALSDPEELRAVGERGFAYVQQRHDWNKIGQMTLECYRSALSR